MASGNETRVDTALLSSTAENLLPIIKSMENIFEQFQQEIKSTRSQWQGDASDDIRNTAIQLKSSSAEMLRVLNGYVSGLRELAGIYDKGENRAQESGRSLKFDSVFQ